MEKTLFDDLVQSLKEAKAIAKGSKKASRRFAVMAPDVKVVRERIGLTQSEFARLMRGEVDDLDVSAIRSSLLEYCKRDTLALVKLHDTLLRYCR